MPRLIGKSAAGEEDGEETVLILGDSAGEALSDFTVV
jgi:hypothetical protein